MEQAPSTKRLHIGIFGPVNSGKSSLLNTLTKQDVSITSDVKGTTTDAVSKTMEIIGVGPVTFIDTAGWDDESSLSDSRMKKTLAAAQKIDIALVVFAPDVKDIFKFKEKVRVCLSSFTVGEVDENPILDTLKKNDTPIIPVLNKIDLLDDEEPTQDNNIINFSKIIKETFGVGPVLFSSFNKRVSNTQELSRAALFKAINEVASGLTDVYQEYTSGLCEMGDTVILVMPQDAESPRGRLILPEVLVLRELLDNKCYAICTSDPNIAPLLENTKAVKLVITDSQVFPDVYSSLQKSGSNVPLTSFSILMARTRGNIRLFVEGAQQIDNITDTSKVLIAEACSHTIKDEDIGTIKIPRMLHKIAAKASIEYVHGQDYFTTDISKYDLVICCGGCMATGKFIQRAQKKAQDNNIPMTNYGVAIAKMNGILDKVVY